jgi:hypothetical protein
VAALLRAQRSQQLERGNVQRIDAQNLEIDCFSGAQGALPVLCHRFLDQGLETQRVHCPKDYKGLQYKCNSHAAAKGSGAMAAIHFAAKDMYDWAAICREAGRTVFLKPRNGNVS